LLGLPNRDFEKGDPQMETVEIYTRVILQPVGGGEPVETFDIPEDPTVEVDTLLATYTNRFGAPFEFAFTAAPDIEGPIEIGWLFAVPHTFQVPGPPEQFEMVLIPMFDDSETGNRISLFLRMAEQREQFQGLFDRGVLTEFHTATLAQRDPDQQPLLSELKSQRRDHDG
jgi:hypothetical protein